MGAAADWRPKAIVLDVSDETFAAQIRSWAESNGVRSSRMTAKLTFDDIVVLGNDPDRHRKRLRSGWPMAASST